MHSFPSQIGPYKILAPLGAGGMGSVFKAVDTAGQFVALKMIGTPEDTRASFQPGTRRLAFNKSRRIALIREARLAMELKHPNIARTLDYGQHRGLLYLVMEHIDGTTLATRLRTESPTLKQRVLWMAQVGDALAFAHRRGVVHRDLHAGNVLVMHDDVVKLLDFGLARRADDDLDPTGMAGVLPFVAPEKFRGNQRPHPIQDIWSAGILLHLSLTGAFPFQGVLPGLVATNILNAMPSPLDATLPCAIELRSLLDRVLQKDPRMRLGDAAQFAAELRRIADLLPDAAGASHVETTPQILPTSDSALLLSVPASEQPTLISVTRRKNSFRSLEHRLGRLDIGTYLKRTGTTIGFGLMLFGYLQPSSPTQWYALAAASGVALLPVVLLYPVRFVLSFTASLADVPRCRSCRSPMQHRSQATEYAVSNIAISLGIADCVAALEANLWTDAVRLLRVHGQAFAPLLPRRIVETPLRFHLDLYTCERCTHQSAVFTVDHHVEDRWILRSRYVKAYRNPRIAQKLPNSPLRLWLWLPVLRRAVHTQLASIRLSAVQCVCTAGLLFMVWFTWVYLHQKR